jgi:hypothetical protein
MNQTGNILGTFKARFITITIIIIIIVVAAAVQVELN